MALKIDKVIAVPTTFDASTVCEPSVCSTSTKLLYTGNWFSYKSTNSGADWADQNPIDFFPSPGVDFCCDQTVIYDPSRKLTFWILQYSSDSNGENVLRIAINKSPSLAKSGWYWWDLKASLQPTWKKQWFDYNHAALSNNFLYVGTNMYNAEDVWKRCVIFRMSLDDLANAASGIKYNFFATTKLGSLKCTAGATTKMYFASHNSESQLKVFEWPENKTTVNEFTVNYTPYSSANGYKANFTNGKNWLDRCDDRITAGFISGNVIGFMWTSNKMQGRPFPFVKCVRIDTSNFSVIDEPDIWNENYAYAFPDASPNGNGEIGVSLFRGGGAEFPTHLIGNLSKTTSQWSLKIVEKSTHGPSDLKWGDYLTCRRAYPSKKGWIASGFVLNGGGTRGFLKPLCVKFSM